MVDQIRKREMLLCVASTVALISGCHSRSHAELGFDSINIDKTEGMYVIEGEIGLGVTGEWDPFRNVSAVGLDEDGTVICRQPIGEVDSEYVGGGKYVSLACDQYPRVITYEIERDPCSPGIGVNKMVYDEERDLWVEESIECE